MRGAARATARSYSPPNSGFRPQPSRRQQRRSLQHRSIQPWYGFATRSRYIAAAQPLPMSVAKATPTTEVVVRWAQQAHAIGQTVVYERLPIRVPIEPPSATMFASCADNHDVAGRMLARHEVIDAGYEQSSIPVIVAQL